MLYRIKKVFLIILIFSVLILTISAGWCLFDCYTFIHNGNTIQSYPNTLQQFILYLIGYGELTTSNETLKLCSTVLGLFTLTLLSSALTVSLFDWNNKISSSKNIVMLIRPRKNINGAFLLSTGTRDLYDVRITLHLTDGYTNFEEYRNISFMSKQTKIPIYFSAELGSVLYRFAYNSIRKPEELTTLVCLISYIDSKSGQSFTECKKYRYLQKRKSNSVLFINTEKDLSNKDILKLFSKKEYRNITSDKLLSEFTLDYHFDLLSAIPIRTPIKYESNGSVISGKIKFDGNTSNTDDFQMIAFPNMIHKDWRIFYDYSCQLSFDVLVKGNITLVFEFKNTDEKNILFQTPEFVTSRQWYHYTLDFKDLNRDQLSSIKELCFTVKDDGKSKTGSISITNLVIKNTKN